MPFVRLIRVLAPITCFLLDTENTPGERVTVIFSTVPPRGLGLAVVPKSNVLGRSELAKIEIEVETAPIHDVCNT